MTKKTRTTKPKDDGIHSISLVSLGCPKNLVDSEKMLGLLAEAGLTPVSCDADSFGGADAVVVNTCGFLEASKDESLGVIKEAIAAKERGELKRVVVAGCLVQRHRAKMLEWAPGIDAMVGVFDRDKIVEAVRGGSERTTLDGAPGYWISGNALIAAKERGRNVTGLTIGGKNDTGVGYFEDDSARLRLTPRHYAYLRVGEGCNQNCAFCTIPSIRGKMRSKPVEAIVREARELIADGAFELMLIGQDTTSWGDDIGKGMAAGAGLPAMLEGVCHAMDEEGCRGWVRLMYAYPSNFSDAMIDAFAGLVSRGRLLPYIDIPLQHASDAMLTKMRRNVTRAKQEHVITRLRERVPGMRIRTTFISGFPGETQADHQELLEFIEKMRFEMVGVFEYSKEDGTPAGRMEEDDALRIPDEVKAQRRSEVMELQQRIAFEQAAHLAGGFERGGLAKATRADVLIDAKMRTSGRKTSGVGEGGRLHLGRTKWQAPQIDGVTYIQSREPLAPGELVPCAIVGADGYDLVAKPIAELSGEVKLKVLK
ncbi:MAG: 30S ribosomal protein S12 methylthiotransferase RimO [Phycisphaerales bacterium]|nr:30S ribosomal protein S12 methylthiotransferase RimO [Phycisphaerales bacterium]